MAKVKFTDTVDVGDILAQKQNTKKNAELKGWRYTVESVSVYGEFILVEATYIGQGSIGSGERVTYKDLNMKKNLWVNLTKEA